MRTMRIVMSFIVLAATIPAWAADDGQTQPKLNRAIVNWSVSSADIVATTNGAGNVKGVQCVFNTPSNVTISFYVNGGSAQSVTIEPGYYPVDFNGDHYTGFIPFNVRFTSSIRVQMTGSAGGPQIACMAAWALD